MLQMAHVTELGMNHLSELFTLSFDIYAFLFIVAVIAAIIDAIAGGGGLLTVPCLLFCGLPPMLALGTNRFQAVIGESTTSLSFLLHQQINPQKLGLGIAFTSLGAIIGTFAVDALDKALLEALIPALMILITIYSIFSGQLKKNQASEPKMSLSLFMCLGGLVLGFYNGFFGPGTGSLWMVAFIALLGYTAKGASMMTKPLNLTGNVISLVLFIYLGHVDYVLGIVMGIGQIIGSLAGSRLVMSHGHRLVRPVFITVTLAMTLKLIYEQFPMQDLAFL